MAITINGTTGIAGVDGSASTPAVQGTDTNTGVFFPAADTIAFGEGGAEVARFDSSGNLGIGTTSPTEKIDVSATSPSVKITGTTGVSVFKATNTGGVLWMGVDSSTGGSFGVGNYSRAIYSSGAYPLVFFTNDTERARIDSSGNLMVGKTSLALGTSGIELYAGGEGAFTKSAAPCLYVNRLADDGDLVRFFQATTQEGTISVSGSTVSYNGGHLSRWAQMLTKPDLLKGTVMSNLDEMNVYVKPTLYWTEDDELPVDEEGNPTVAVGDVKQETSVSENEQLNKVKVSDVEGDVNVAGVFVNWTYDDAHQVDEINMAMTGDMIIRIAQGVVVQKGDLLMSAGDGTAKPQGDDIVRSKTVAKVTSNHVTCTYADGSYCVPCVLMAC